MYFSTRVTSDIRNKPFFAQNKRVRPYERAAEETDGMQPACRPSFFME
ncbi:hypothetical protein HMPREF9413_3864 [Paenibacillus sp. HGF7]|nr:hypothetical protein HMPREF9413_3864 [Paenibacillus sp. HGF7]